MGIAPGLAHDTIRRLRSIDRHFTPRWNRNKMHWEIWFESRGRIPYMVTPVVNENQQYIPIDNRTFRKLRRTLWYNQRIMDTLREIEYAEERAQMAADEKERQKFRDIAMDNLSLFRTIQREAGLDSGKTKIPYSPGFGEGYASNS